MGTPALVPVAATPIVGPPPLQGGQLCQQRQCAVPRKSPPPAAAPPHPTPQPPLPQKKGWACTREQLNELRAFKRRVLAYPSCAELLFDDFLRAGLLVAQEA